MSLFGQDRVTTPVPYPTVPIIVGIQLFQDGFVSSLVQGDVVVHWLDMHLQCRVVGRKAVQL